LHQLTHVLAGVIEPPSASPVVIEDNVLIGANAVILEGVRVGEGAIVASFNLRNADTISRLESSTSDVCLITLAGVPATTAPAGTSEVEDSKREIVSALRKLND
jgi:tetrahydrodipicolinate N-acetyltransferase